MLKSSIATMDTRTVRVEKTADPHYGSAGHKDWREAVLKRAGYRCEVVEQSSRCTRRAPEYAIYADHINEITDGGAKLDLANGMALCAHHHTKKTLAARAARAANTPS